MKTLALLLLLMGAVLAAPVFVAGPAGAAPVDAAGPADAVPDTFADPAMEARARAMQRQLRCLVCQGESIDESRSPFAGDVRQLVRQQMAQGKSDQQIQDFLVARYGDFILMKPPVNGQTWLLWLAPFLVLAVGGGVAWVTVKKASRTSA